MPCFGFLFFFFVLHFLHAQESARVSVNVFLVLLECVCARWPTSCGVKLLLFRGRYFIRDVTPNETGYPLFNVSAHFSHSSAPHPPS